MRKPRAWDANKYTHVMFSDETVQFIHEKGWYAHVGSPTEARAMAERLLRWAEWREGKK